MKVGDVGIFTGPGLDGYIYQITRVPKNTNSFDNYFGILVLNFGTPPEFDSYTVNPVTMEHWVPIDTNLEKAVYGVNNES